MWKFWKRKARAESTPEVAPSCLSFEEARKSIDVKKELYLHMSRLQAKGLPFIAEDVAALVFMYYNYRVHWGPYRFKDCPNSSLYFTIVHCHLVEKAPCEGLDHVVFVMEDDSHGTRTRLTVRASELPQILEPLKLDMSRLRGSGVKNRPNYPSPGIYKKGTPRTR